MQGVKALAVYTATTVMSLVSGMALADGVTTTISGFGTVGGTFTSDGKYGYIHDASEFLSANNQINIGLDSRLGVQATFNFGSGLTVTAQEIARSRGAKTFDPATEWLYLQYAPNSDLKLRLGRTALGTFLLSDSRYVGYAAPWFRAPNDVYFTELFSYSDGVQGIWHKHFGEFVLGLQGSFGTTQANFQGGGVTINSTAKDVVNAAVSLEYGNWLLRVAQTNFNLPGALPIGPTVLHLLTKDKFTSVGVQYDNGKALLIGEWSKRTQNDVPGFNLPIIASSQWYAGAGWRFGKFMPMAIYSKFTAEKSLRVVEGDYGSWHASLRYDVVRNVALKAQISRAGADNSTYWTVSTPNSNQKINVYSFGADFLF